MLWAAGWFWGEKRGIRGGVGRVLRLSGRSCRDSWPSRQNSFFGVLSADEGASDRMLKVIHRFLRFILSAAW